MILRLFAVGLLWLMAANSAIAEEKTGTIVGVVRYTGDVPGAKKVVTTDGAVILHRDLIVDEVDKGLKAVAIHIENAPAAVSTEKKPIVVDQRDMLFLPRVVALQEGRPIRFENNDLCNHAVQALSTVNENCFNQTTPPSQPFDFTFKPQKGPIMIGCPIHGWMRAWVYVFPHPYFALSDDHGRFRIDKVPAGKHALIFRHPDTGLYQRREIDVAAGETTRVAVEWRATEK